MSTTTLSDRITVTRHPDGALTVNGYVQRPLFTDDPDGRTYKSEVFHGYYGRGYALSTIADSAGAYSILPEVEVDAAKAEQYLTALADLAVRANEAIR